MWVAGFYYRKHVIINNQFKAVTATAVAAGLRAVTYHNRLYIIFKTHNRSIAQRYKCIVPAAIK